MLPRVRWRSPRRCAISAATTRLCLPPKRKTARRRPSTSIQRQSRQAIAIPAGYTRVPPGRSSRRSPLPRRPLRIRSRPAFGLFPADGLRRRTRGHLHALRLPDDSVHGFVFHQPPDRERERDGVVQAIVFCLGIIVFFTGLGVLITKAIVGTVRRGAARQQSVGERLHRRWCSSSSD